MRAARAACLSLPVVTGCARDDRSAPPSECAGSAVDCSADAFTLKTCEGGRWRLTECMRERGKLCDVDRCVEPWRHGSPEFDPCACEPRATPESPTQKAECIGDMARRPHVHPKLGWIADVWLPCDGTDGSEPGVPETSALATGDPKSQRFYDDCLLQRAGEATCIHHQGATPAPHDDVLSPVGLNLGCKANWNDGSMDMLSLHGRLWGEHDLVVRQKAEAVLEGETWSPPGYERPLSEPRDALFDFIHAAGKAPGPNRPPAHEAVKSGLCRLRPFPSREVPPVDLTCRTSSCVELRKARFGQPMTDYPRPVAERCVTRFPWWGSPYTTEACTASPRYVRSTADDPVACRMGRYHGFIDPEG